MPRPAPSRSHQTERGRVRARHAISGATGAWRRHPLGSVKIRSCHPHGLQAWNIGIEYLERLASGFR